MTDFPNNYKIVGAGLFASEKSSVINRSDDDILIVFGDVGGMAAFVGLFLAYLVERFGELNLRTNLISRLYKQNEATNYTKNKKGKENLRGEIQISPPDCLELMYLFKTVLCCCCPCFKVKNSDWARYMNKVDIGYDHL